MGQEGSPETGLAAIMPKQGNRKMQDKSGQYGVFLLLDDGSWKHIASFANLTCAKQEAEYCRAMLGFSKVAIFVKL